jgi:hypothetical protein
VPNPNAIVSRVAGFEPPLDRPAAQMGRVPPDLNVVLEDGRRVRLDEGDRRSTGLLQVLEGLRRERLLAYLEIDPATSIIARLRIPKVVRVTALSQTEPSRLDVELHPSHARHVLRRDAPDFEELETQLREALQTRAWVVVTETDAHEIIDVRPYTPGAEGTPHPFGEPDVAPRKRGLWQRIRYLLRAIRDLLRAIVCWIQPSYWFCCVSLTKAREIFNAMSATSCSPLTVPGPCIPFLYPDDGCWARAHEMCRLMIDMGHNPRKVWIEGWLQVSTKNHPDCVVYWRWHVAPTLCVRTGGSTTEYMVIDPSLFSTPVSKATWKGVQGEPNATLIDSSASVYYYWDGSTDPNYTQTNYYLAVYRLELLNRATQYGPPPYANCP